MMDGWMEIHLIMNLYSLTEYVLWARLLLGMTHSLLNSPTDPEMDPL